MKNEKQYNIIVLEGVDCVGKTTLAKKLESELRFQYLYTPQPPIASIRKEVESINDLQTRFFYYLTSVIAVQPLLHAMTANNGLVIIDRYIYSTFAMHKAMGAKVKCVNMRQLPILWPHIGILLTADRETRRQRRMIRGENIVACDQRIEQTDNWLDLAQEIYKTYKELTIIDTSSLDINQVYEKVYELFMEKRRK